MSVNNIQTVRKFITRLIANKYINKTQLKHLRKQGNSNKFSIG